MHLRLPVAVALLSLFAVGPARADRLPLPDPCDYKEIGEACEDHGAKGTCVEHTCSRLSYVGGERKSVPYPRKRCDTKPAETSKDDPVAAEPPAQDPPGPESGADPVKTPEANAPAPSTAEAKTAEASATKPEATQAEATKPGEASASKGMCTVDPTPKGAPLLLLGLSLIVLRRRR